MFDSSASSTSTSNRNDFVEGSFVPLSGVTVSGIASGLEVKGYSMVSWNFCMQKGEVLTIDIKKLLHIPNILTRLISPQQICQQYGRATCFSLDSSFTKLSFQDHAIAIPCDYSSNLPITCTGSNTNNDIKAYNLHAVELDNLSRQ